MYPLAILDLAPIAQGSNARQAFKNSLDLAQHAEKWGYHRYWLAEHHGMPGIGSSATAVLMGYIAAGTKKMIIGAGGVMLPNHSPLVIAEQYATLEALYPKRIELGLGRAPGSDQKTAHSLRQNLDVDAEDFPADVVELMQYFKGGPATAVKAVPGAGTTMPTWILGSSLFGASLAAHLGLPYSFASHFAPAMLMDAVQYYRDHFQPSEYLDKPYVMTGFNAFVADTDEEAVLLASSTQQSFVQLHQGTPSQLPPPQPDYYKNLDTVGRAILQRTLSVGSAIGSVATVKEKLQNFINMTQSDEVIVGSAIYDHQARLRSYELLAQIATDLTHP